MGRTLPNKKVSTSCGITRVCRSEMELEDRKIFKPEVRKFLILTNERKIMSKTTIRKRISLTVASALSVSMLSVIATPNVANAAATHLTAIGVSSPNTLVAGDALNRSLYVANRLSNTGAVVPLNGAVNVAGPDGSQAHLNTAGSLGLLSKDATTSTAQTATMLTGGALSLYTPVSATSISFVATGGTFNTSPAAVAGTVTYSQDRRTLLSVVATATTIGLAWTAPTTAGTYSISMYNGASGVVDLDTPARTLAAAITVTVVATSAGSSYSAAYSACRIENSGTPTFGITSNVDDTALTGNTGTIYVEFTLKDAYNANLDNGNIVATATNGALLAYANGGAVGPGTAATVVAFDSGSADAIRINQPTANTPVTTTVTITYNGTTVCTKTFGIAGEVAKLTVNVTDVQDLSASAGKADFLADGWGPVTARAGHFTVYAQDSANNPVATSAIGTFGANAASLAGQTIVTALSVDSSATVTSSSSPGRLSTGIYTCGATAGEVKTAKFDFTNTSSGKVVTSDAFTLRCADNPSSMTASFDKASYVQGEIATLTVKFLDSKGNPANSTSDTGPWVGVTPMLTNISTTGAAGGLDKNGEKKFTYTVGTTAGLTAGTYTAVINYTTLTSAGTATTQTPTYKVTTGGDTTSNADILKSIVALIASINKQIQALQKLILKR